MRHLNRWQLLPRPQRLTELYFDNSTPLPSIVKGDVPQKIAFVIHNSEHRSTLYHYKLVAVGDDDSSGHLLGEGNVSLAHDQSQTTSKVIKVPSISSRVAVKINLEYEGIAFGDTAPSHEDQSIQYWTKVTGLHP